MRIGAARAVVIPAVAAVAVCGAACGAENAAQGPPPASSAPPSAGSTESSGTPSAAPDTDVGLSSSPRLAEIRQRGKLLVGVSADAPEFVTREGAGEYGGFDVEIAKLLAERLGLDPGTQVSFRRLPASMLRDGVAGGNVDLLLGPPQEGLPAAGTYAVVDGAPRVLTVPPGDRRFRAELGGHLDELITGGAWQRAYDATLGEQGVPAEPR
ncbi:transporter substrate-binding domain-containing protein [Bounagaea algeriensis]